MTQINCRVDETTKQDAEKILGEMGMSISTAINIFLKTVCREHRIPFEITTDPFYSTANQEYLRKLYRDVQEGRAKFAEHDLIEVDE